jgi:hypothetical protein
MAKRCLKLSARRPSYFPPQPQTRHMGLQRGLLENPTSVSKNQRYGDEEELSKTRLENTFRFEFERARVILGSGSKGSGSLGAT